MEVNIKTVNQIVVVDVTGNIDGNNAPTIQAQVMPLAQPASKIIIDLSNVPYMSSAGLRMLLSIYRQITGGKGRVVLVGLSTELKDTMALTGFLSFFTVYDSVDAALTALNA